MSVENIEPDTGGIEVVPAEELVAEHLAELERQYPGVLGGMAQLCVDLTMHELNPEDQTPANREAAATAVNYALGLKEMNLEEGNNSSEEPSPLQKPNTEPAGVAVLDGDAVLSFGVDGAIIDTYWGDDTDAEGGFIPRKRPPGLIGRARRRRRQRRMRDSNTEGEANE